MKASLFRLSIGIFLAIGVVLGSALPSGTALASDLCVDPDGVTCPYTTIQDAVTAAAPGDTIHVHAGTYVLSSMIDLNKAGLTLQGEGNPLIQVSGTGERLHISASDVTIDGFKIEKTDKSGPQNIIAIAASNTSITNNEIFGHFVIGEGDVSRAMVIYAGAFSGLDISGNSIHELRQPAYISGTHTGTISNNYVYLTKGWVVEGGNLTFTGNTWGTGAEANVFDIAILSLVGPTSYPDIAAMAAANNDAVIEDQRVSPAVLSTVYVDASTAYSSDLGGRFHPYSTITPAIARVVAGGTIHVAAGAYAEDLQINKALSLLGPNADINPNTGARVGEAILYPGTSHPEPAVCTNIAYLRTSNITIKGFLFDGDNPVLTSGVNLNGADLNACEILAGYEGMGNIIVENNIIQNAAEAGIDFYNYINTAATSGNYIRYNLINNIGIATTGYGQGVIIYNNFYADVTDNVLNDVRLGIQTGNFHLANPGTEGRIANNEINTWRLGIFHNLWYSGASTISVENNTINAVTNAAANKWNGILISSFGSAVNTLIVDNNINIPDAVSFAAPGYTAGYNVWNDTTSAPLTISGGTVTGGDYGVFVNNYEGYTSNANNTSIHVSNVTLQDSKIAGVYVKDSPLNTNSATVFADVQNSTIDSLGTGILLEGADASAQANFNRISGNPTEGVTNPNAALMNARYNWWGAVSGPGTVGPGTGDKVSANVDFTPWCNNPDCILPVHNVTKNTYYWTIQAAIDAAANGDTINIGAGTYVENVIVNKSVTLAGAGAATTTVMPAISDPNCGGAGGGSLCAGAVMCSWYRRTTS